MCRLLFQSLRVFSFFPFHMSSLVVKTNHRSFLMDLLVCSFALYLTLKKFFLLSSSSKRVHSDALYTTLFTFMVSVCNETVFTDRRSNQVLS